MVPLHHPLYLPNALKSRVLHGPKCLELVHYLGLEKGRKVTAASYLSDPLLLFVLSQHSPDLTASSHFPIFYPGGWQPQPWQWLFLLLPQAAAKLLSSKFLQSLYTRGRVGISILTPPVGKPQPDQLLKESKAAKCWGEKLKGRGCISVALCGTTREHWQLVKIHEQSHSVTNQSFAFL